jgi:hypothetical protein
MGGKMPEAGGETGVVYDTGIEGIVLVKSTELRE